MAGEQDNKPGEQKPADNQPKYVTAEEVANMVTGASARHAKELKKELSESFASVLDERLKAFKPEPPAEPPADDKGKEKKPDPEIAALRAQLQTLAKKAEDSEAARQKAEMQARLDSGKSALRSALQSQVRPELLDTAVDLLFEARKRVTFDDSGKPLFSIRQSPMAGFPEEDTPMPLSDGVGHWLKSDEAKFFLPAPGTKEAPVQRQGGPRVPAVATQLPTYEKPATTDEEKIRRANERAAAFEQRRRAPQ